MEGRLQEPWFAQAQLIVPEDRPFVTLPEPLAVRVSEKGDHLTAQVLTQWSPVQLHSEGQIQMAPSKHGLISSLKSVS